MLVKIDDGFYLNTQHIISVNICKNPFNHEFEVTLGYTPHTAQNAGEFKKKFSSQLEAEIFLSELHQKVR